MIGFLSGKILRKDEDTILINVSGVGYQVFLGDTRAFGSGEPGSALELFIHTYVREDQITLFGFKDAIAKQIFHTLIAINGVGPKMAMALLARLTPPELVNAVTLGDTRALRSVPGVGQKMADRLVLELKGKLASVVKQASWTETPGSKDLALWSDLSEALSGLGFSDQNIRNVIKSLEPDLDGITPDINQLLKLALQKIKNC